MRRLATAGVVAGALFGLAQCVRLPASNPPVRGDLVAPAEVKTVLRHACYDCHSNETRWPWYSAIAPVSWVIRRDVAAGRQHLNFSDWTDYESDPETAALKLRRIATALRSDDMAPRYYRLLHADARLSAAQRESVVRWSEQAAAHHSPSPDAPQETTS
jgi:hypothetical protein